MTEKSAATVTIRNAAKMSVAGRRSVALWLRRHATWLVKHADQYAPRMTAKYLYRKAKP